MGSKKHKDIIIDTSFFIALAKANDTHHEKVKKLAKFHSKKVWITTWPVISELSHVLSTNPFLALLEERFPKIQFWIVYQLDFFFFHSAKS